MTANRPPLGGDHDRAITPVAARGSASRGAGDREIDLLVAVVAAAPDAPQCEDRESCESSPYRCILFVLVVTLTFSELVSPG
jgi:hypothetical protein